MDKIKIGISIGDINGIGLEVIIKTLMTPQITDYFTPVVYGSSKVVSYHKNVVGLDFQFQPTRAASQLLHDKVNVVNCWQENVNITLGKPTDVSGKYAFKSLEMATQDLRSGLIDALVTAPINKHAMKMADFPFPGHTEYLTQQLGADESVMLMVSDSLRIGLVTNHLPISEVAKNITREKVMKKIQIMSDSLKVDFGIDRPTIAVLGLNPHAGDQGVLGNEEERIIRPAIVEMKKRGIIVTGPFPADGFFGSGEYNKYDGILAMYHDQGLIPFKALSFGSGVNYTAGLPAVRTSPDHGTAYDIAGQNEADPTSLRQALFLALDIARSRMAHTDMYKNALVRRSKPLAEDDEDEGLLDDDDDDLEDNDFEEEQLLDGDADFEDKDRED